MFIAYRLWAQEVSGSQLVIFIDNNAVRDCLISCDSSNVIASTILKKILKLEDAVKVLAWYTRVPSPSNIADDPSRGECEFLKSLKCLESKVDVDGMLQGIGLIDKRGEEQAS